MKRAGVKLLQTVVWSGFSGLLLTGLIAPSHCQAFDASINISPNIINLDSIDHFFGIHTNVPYSIVNIDEVILVCPEGAALYPAVCYADSRGYLIAKFETAELEAACSLSIGEDNTLILEGGTKEEPVETFSGSAEVLIIETQARLLEGNGPKASQHQWGRNR